MPYLILHQQLNNQGHYPKVRTLHSCTISNLGKTSSQYAVYDGEGDSIFEDVKSYLKEDNHVYIVTQDQLMILDLKKNNDQIKSLEDSTEEERLILEKIKKDPLGK